MYSADVPVRAALHAACGQPPAHCTDAPRGPSLPYYIVLYDMLLYSPYCST